MHHPTHHRPRFGRPGAKLILILALSLALLAELAAARELAGLVRTCEGLPIEVRTALAAYDRAVKGQSDGNL